MTELLDSSRVTRKHFQVGCAVITNLLMTCYGLTMPSSAYLLPQLEDHKTGFGMTKDQGSWITSIAMVGSMTGALAGGWQCEKFGRKKSLMISCILHIIGILMSALAPNFYTMFAARIVLGHAAASSLVVSPIYVSEICQPQVRKMTGTFTVMFYSLGMALTMTLGASLKWRYALGLITVAPMICLLGLWFCPESPTWLVYQGKSDKALVEMIFLRGESNMDVVDFELLRIGESVQRLSLKQANAPEGSNTWYGKVKYILEPTFMKPFLFLMLIIPIGLEWTGFAAVRFYTVSIVEDSGIPIDPFWTSAILCYMASILALIGTTVIARFRRRLIYLFCCFAISVGTLSFGLFCYFTNNGQLNEGNYNLRWIPVFSLIAVYIGFSFGHCSIPYMLQGEILPAHARSFGASCLGLCDNFSLFVSTKIVPWLIQTIGLHGTFMLYASVCAFVGIVSFFIMPETSGKTLEEIEAMYKPHTKKETSV